MQARIFVQIASYRDPELVPTLRDCIAMAARPDLLRFGIAWQHDGTETLAEFAGDPRFRVFECDWRESRGACWARHALQEFYDGEEFTLALDSHHRFRSGWDRALKAQLRRLPSAKPVLTAYLPAYEPGKPLARLPAAINLCAADSFTKDGVLLYEPRLIRRKYYRWGALRARFLSAHFVFATGNFVEECRHDPKLYFHGEELSLSARAWTHGWDLFHPRNPVIYHHYTREGRPKHWDDHDCDSGFALGFLVLDHLSKRRLRALFGMEEAGIDFGQFGFGTARALAEYEAFAGVNFRQRTISEAAIVGSPPGPVDSYDRC